MNKYLARLLSRTRQDGDCLIFTGYINPDGYGMFGIKNKVWRTHRAMYFLMKGEIPKGMYVCHSCDKPACINIDHLWLGTQFDNMNDMYSKNRGCLAENKPNNKIPSWLRQELADKYKSGISQLDLAKEYNCHPVTIWNAIHHILPVEKNFKGESHSRAILTEKDIKEIREKHAHGIQRKNIAQEYGIAPVTITAIVTRRNWSHVP